MTKHLMRKASSFIKRFKVADDLQKYSIGLRTLKTVLAVWVCLVIFFFWDEHSAGLYACSAAVICMKKTHGESWAIGKQRLWGTLIGGTLGFVLIEFLVEGLPGYFNQGFYLLILPVGLLLCVWMCVITKQFEGVAVGCILLLSIGLDTAMVADSGNALYAVLLRMAELAIGMSVAAIINQYFFPLKSKAEEI